MIVVADSSPLIALCRAGRLELLHDLFGLLILPEAVWQPLILRRRVLRVSLLHLGSSIAPFKTCSS